MQTFDYGAPRISRQPALQPVKRETVPETGSSNMRRDDATTGFISVPHMMPSN